jgi:hypothetical protein
MRAAATGRPRLAPRIATRLRLRPLRGLVVLSFVIVRVEHVVDGSLHIAGADGRAAPGRGARRRDINTRCAGARFVSCDDIPKIVACR